MQKIGWLLIGCLLVSLTVYAQDESSHYKENADYYQQYDSTEDEKETDEQTQLDDEGYIRWMYQGFYQQSDEVTGNVYDDEYEDTITENVTSNNVEQPESYNDKQPTSNEHDIFYYDDYEESTEDNDEPLSIQEGEEQ